MDLTEVQRGLILQRDGFRCKGCENAGGAIAIRIGDWPGPIVPLWEWKCVCVECHEKSITQAFLNLDIDFDNPDRRRRFKQYYKSEVWIRKWDRILRRDKGTKAWGHPKAPG